MVKTIEITTKHKLVKANNPKVGDKIWTLRGKNNENSFEHVLTEKINDEVFKTNKSSAQHIDNMWYEV